jgi:hypothetical protein
MPELAADSNPNTPINTGGAVKPSPDSAQHIRALAMPFSKGSMITEPDGSLLIKDVPMLAEGVWTDSAVGTPLNYIPRTLEADATNWLDNSGWNRHVGKVPRASTDKVGEAVNPHFGRFTGEDGREHAAVLSDVRVWPWTQNQRDMQEMIRHNLISFVSVEHGGQERYNTDTRQMEAASLTFTGFAFVNKGACKLCRLNEEPQPSTEPKEETPASEPEQDTMADTKELEAKVEQLTKELEATKAQKPTEVKVEIPKELSALPGSIKELSELVKAQAARIDALEKDGNPKTDGTPGKELEEPVNARIVIDRKAGTIRSV